MRYLPVLILATASISLSAQTISQAASSNTAAQATTQAGSASFAQSSNVSAELTKKVDTKNAKVGDEVVAKTTSSAQLTDGTKVPRGTKLVGQVTEVHAKSSSEKTSHLAFAINKAILRDGREIPMHAALTSLSAPASMALSDESGTDDLQKNPAAIGNGGSRGGGGGLLAGTTRTTGAVAGNATSALGNTTNGLLRSTSSVGASGMGAVAAVPGRLDHASIPNMPGVTLSSTASSTSSASLDASGRNIALESGTQMTMQVGVN